MARVARIAVAAVFAGALALVPGVANADTDQPAHGTSCVICWPGWS